MVKEGVEYQDANDARNSLPDPLRTPQAAGDEDFLGLTPELLEANGEEFFADLAQFVARPLQLRNSF